MEVGGGVGVGEGVIRNVSTCQYFRSLFSSLAPYQRKDGGLRCLRGEEWGELEHIYISGNYRANNSWG